MQKIDGGELVVRTLVKAGIREIFTLHGGHLEPIYSACVRHEVKLLDTRHEAAAGHAAQGYAKATGQLGVALVTAGAGFTNVVTALADAHVDGVPILVITGAAPLRDAETNPLQGGFDQVAVAQPVTKWAHRVTDVHRIPHLVAHGIRTAMSGRPGPVLIEIPVDVLFRQVNAQAVKIPSADIAVPPAPSPTSIQQMIDLLRTADRPVLMAGSGVLFSGSGDLLTQLAEITNTPVFTNCKAHGVIPTDHPLCGRDFSTLQYIEGSKLDAALILGARLGRYTGGVTDSLLPFDARLAVVDIEGAEIGRLRDIAIPVNADCKQTLLALVDAARQHPWPDRSHWRAAVQRATGWHQRRFQDALSTTREPIHPYRATHEVLAALDNPIVTTDGGEAINWAEMAAHVSGHGAFMVTGYLGCLGTGLPYALGAQLAHPKRQVVCITGDGALGFNIQEFDTLARHGLPVITVVMNNKSWGMSTHGQDALYGPGHRVVSELAQTRYDVVAEGFGCYGEFVTRCEDIQPAMRRARESGRPACINIVIDDTVVAPFTEALLGQKKKESDIILPYYDNLETAS